MLAKVHPLRTNRQTTTMPIIARPLYVLNVFLTQGRSDRQAVGQ